MEAFWFWLILVLLLIMVFAWPTWPYTRDRGVYRRGGAWRYGLSGAAGGGVALLLLLFWFGIIFIAVPWNAPA